MPSITDQLATMAAAVWFGNRPRISLQTYLRTGGRCRAPNTARHPRASIPRLGGMQGREVSNGAAGALDFV